MERIIFDLLKDNVDINKAKELQEKYKKYVKLIPFDNPKTITGVDISYKANESNIGVATVVTLSYPSMKILEVNNVKGDILFPYVPGMLAFRELNLISKALFKLSTPPELILFDGHGIAHPQFFGAASQLGVALNIPTIGCAKKLFFGKIIQEIATYQFAKAEIQIENITVGVAIRMQENINPIFISPGHLIDVKSSIEIIKKCSIGFRIPEPTRQADLLSREILRTMEI